MRFSKANEKIYKNSKVPSVEVIIGDVLLFLDSIVIGKDFSSSNFKGCDGEFEPIGDDWCNPSNESIWYMLLITLSICRASETYQMKGDFVLGNGTRKSIGLNFVKLLFLSCEILS
ncbi:13432_t:CDS:2 [Entrophospora sp. SA101]|nr:13432_t:CDS:2 [Entrophospora sp. SA101]